MSRDPLGMWGDPGQRGNAQNYCGNNPVNRVDPTGDWAFLIPIAVGIIKGALAGAAIGGSAYGVAEVYAQHQTTNGFQASGDFRPGLVLETSLQGAKGGAAFGAGAGAVGGLARVPRIVAIISRYGAAGQAASLFGQGLAGQASSDLYHGRASEPGQYALSGLLMLSFGGLQSWGSARPVLGSRLRDAPRNFMDMLRPAARSDCPNPLAIRPVAREHLPFDEGAEIRADTLELGQPCPPRPQTGDIFERTFETRRGPVDMLAEIEVQGNTLTLRDICVFGRGQEPLTGLSREVFQVRTQLVNEARDLGFEQLRLLGTRVPTSTSANPGHPVDVTIDLGRGVGPTGGVRPAPSPLEQQR